MQAAISKGCRFCGVGSFGAELEPGHSLSSLHRVHRPKHRRDLPTDVRVSTVSLRLTLCTTPSPLRYFAWLTATHHNEATSVILTSLLYPEQGHWLHQSLQFYTPLLLYSSYYPSIRSNLVLTYSFRQSGSWQHRFGRPSDLPIDLINATLPGGTAGLS